MERDFTLPTLPNGDAEWGESERTDTTLADGDCGEKRLRVANPGLSVDGDVEEEHRPVKLPKIAVSGDVGTSEVASNDRDGKTNAVHGVVSVMGRQRAMTTAVSTVVDEIPSYDIFGIFDGVRLAKFFEERLRRLVKEEVTACHRSGLVVDWNKVMTSCFSEAMGTAQKTAAEAVVTVVGKEEVVVLCRGGARVVLYTHGGVALPLCHIHHHQNGEDQILKIHKRKKVDDFIVLACEGLWQAVSDDDTYQLVKCCLRGKSPDGFKSESSTTQAAVILAELAIARGSKENINVIVIDLKSSIVS